MQAALTKSAGERSGARRTGQSGVRSHCCKAGETSCLNAESNAILEKEVEDTQRTMSLGWEAQALGGRTGAEAGAFVGLKEEVEGVPI